LDKLDTIGHNWTQLDTIGHNWTQLDTIGHNWTQLDTIGHNWTRLDNLVHYLNEANFTEKFGILHFVEIVNYPDGKISAVRQLNFSHISAYIS
jgi:hypothetical protein